jgi:hypothetical protein
LGPFIKKFVGKMIKEQQQTIFFKQHAEKRIRKLKRNLLNLTEKRDAHAIKYKALKKMNILLNLRNDKKFPKIKELKGRSKI